MQARESKLTQWDQKKSNNDLINLVFHTCISYYMDCLYFQSLVLYKK